MKNISIKKLCEWESVYDYFISYVAGKMVMDNVIYRKIDLFLLFWIFNIFICIWSNLNFNIILWPYFPKHKWIKQIRLSYFDWVITFRLQESS